MHVSLAQVEDFTVIFEASISATYHNKSSIISESQCGDFYLNLWSSGQPYMRSVVYSVKWWSTPTYWIYLLLVFTLIMTLQSIVYRMIILLTFLHVFHKRFYLRWPASSKLQWDAYSIQLKHVTAIKVTILKVVHWRIVFLSLCKGELVSTQLFHMPMIMSMWSEGESYKLFAFNILYSKWNTLNLFYIYAWKYYMNDILSC